MAKIQAIGSVIVAIRHNAEYEIQRTGRNSYVVSRQDRDPGTGIVQRDEIIATVRSSSAAFEAIDADSFKASMIPSTRNAIANVTYMACHASTVPARLFWTLRLNRMFIQES